MVRRTAHYSRGLPAFLGWCDRSPCYASRPHFPAVPTFT
ncbi:hypothetical protein SZ55_4120 [Pseudomonas sp. FeS53a]|nr:hypothetical protein SZ55_4120 [Pseudomonas sp. FeS53a]